jgi:hypothetical protein
MSAALDRCESAPSQDQQVIDAIAGAASPPPQEPDCTCDGGPQGEGLDSIPHDPTCPVYAWERRP